MLPFFYILAPMTKDQLIPLLDPNTDGPVNNWWKEAFKLYNDEFPNNDLRIGCKSCRKTVYNWLKK